jgi:Sigma-70 region 2
VRVKTVDRKPDTSAIDERFVRAIYDEHGPLLLRYVMAITHDRQAAEDIVQETVLRAWRRAGRLASDDRPLRPWLMRVRAQPRHRSEAADLDGPRTGVVGRPRRNCRGRYVRSRARCLAVGQRGRAAESRSPQRAGGALFSRPLSGRGCHGARGSTGDRHVAYVLRALKLILEEQGWV